MVTPWPVILSTSLMRHFPFILVFILSAALSAQTDSPTGRWKTIDDETGETKSIIQIYAQGDEYHGKIAEILTGNTTAICEECDGSKKNKPILGMVIIEGLNADPENPGEWEGGTILDPQKGATYRLSVWFENNDPNALYIRGKHWTGLYRTQKWIRE